MKKIFILCLVQFLISSALAQDQTLIILHTNDHHGHYNSFDHGVGGLSAQKTFVDQVRKEAKEKHQQVLLLSGGDINTGTFESDLQNAEPDFKGMSIIGYDAMAVGNHEWDHPLEIIRSQQQWANFPFLSANTRYRDSQKHVFDSWMVVCLPKNNPTCDLKVGIFGLTTPETSYIVSPNVVKNIVFTDPIKEAKLAVKELKKQNVDVIVAVTHMGHDGAKRDHHGKIQYRDAMIAKAVSGIDVIVGGHTHVALPKPLEVNNTLIVQAKDWGKYVGQLQLDFKKIKGKLHRQKSYQYELVPINPVSKVIVSGKEVYQLPPSVIALPEDPSLLAFFSPFNKKAEELGNQVVGKISMPLDGTRSFVRSQPMPIGLWIAQIFQHETKSDFSMMNGGGIRSSLKSGVVTKRDLHSVHPFENALIYVPLSPEKVLEYVTYGFHSMLEAKEELLEKVPDLNGAYPHWSGLQIKAKGNQICEIVSTDEKNPWKIEVKNGKVVSSTKKTYLFSTINFIAKGGDGYPKIEAEKDYVETGLSIDQLLMKDFEKHSKEIPTLEEELKKHPPLINL